MSYNIEIRNIEARPVMSARRKSTQAELKTVFHEVLPAAFQHILASGGQPAGAPFARYHTWEENNVDVEAGIPVTQPIAGSGEIVASELPGGQMAVVDHFGPYEGLHAGYEALHRWMAENGYKAAGAPFEIYWTDPGEEPDQSKWRTEILYPVTK